MDPAQPFFSSEPVRHVCFELVAKNKHKFISAFYFDSQPFFPQVIKSLIRPERVNKKATKNPSCFDLSISFSFVARDSLI